MGARSLVIFFFVSSHGSYALLDAEAQHRKPLCSYEHEYMEGRWIHNASIGLKDMPFHHLENNSLHPHCDGAFQRARRHGTTPQFTKYQWHPWTCELARFDPQTFCTRLNGKNIGMIGDSTQEMFAHYLHGTMHGHLDHICDSNGQYCTNELCGDYLCTGSEQCSVRLLWLRANTIAETPEDDFRALIEDSDYLIVNFGVHYVEDDKFTNELGVDAEELVVDVEETAKITHAVTGSLNSTQRLEQQLTKMVSSLKALLEGAWSKPFNQIFWRATMAGHTGCEHFTIPFKQPIRRSDQRIFNDEFHHAEIFIQERRFVWPEMHRLNVTILHTDSFTMLRGDGHLIRGRYKETLGNNVHDCLHYCAPGGPVSTWLDLLYHHLLGHFKGK